MEWPRHVTSENSRPIRKWGTKYGTSCLVLVTRADHRITSSRKVENRWIYCFRVSSLQYSREVGTLICAYVRTCTNTELHYSVRNKKLSKIVEHVYLGLVNTFLKSSWCLTNGIVGHCIEQNNVYTLYILHRDISLNVGYVKDL